MGDTRLDFSKMVPDLNQKSNDSAESSENLYRELLQSGSLVSSLAQTARCESANSDQKAARFNVDEVNTLHICGLVERKLKALDLNDDKRLDLNELRLGAQTNKLTPAEGIMLSFVIKNFDFLRGSTQSPTYEPNPVLTMADMFEFNDWQNRTTYGVQSARDAEKLATDNFAQIDKDKDGFLTLSELQGYRQTLKDDTQKGLMSYLNARFLDCQNTSNDELGFENDGITKNDLREYREGLEKEKDIKLVIKLNDELKSTRDHLLEAHTQLYADMKNPRNSITPDAIKPGCFGNAAFEDYIRNLAKSDPDSIIKAIKRNPDGSYVVELPDITPTSTPDTFTNLKRPLMRTGLSRHLDVPAPTTAELAMYSTGGEYGQWPALLAKAWGRYLDRLNSEENTWRRRSGCFDKRSVEQMWMDTVESYGRGAISLEVRPTNMPQETLKNFQTKIKFYDRDPAIEKWQTYMANSGRPVAPKQDFELRLRWDPSQP